MSRHPCMPGVHEASVCGLGMLAVRTDPRWLMRNEKYKDFKFLASIQ